MTASDEMDDAKFPGYVAERLSSVPGVMAVALGGSRAAGTQRPDSDWDFSLYYRGRFEPHDLRALGWPGEISRIGGWGGGVFNGGAWLRADGRPVDVHYRDLDEVEWHLAEAIEGRFRIERLLFHLAGVPTYIVVAELAVNVVLYGGLPSPGSYPDRLRQAAHERWLADARHTLGYARGEWITNEKALLDRAGFRRADEVLGGLTADPLSLVAAVDAASDLIGETAG